ncbi:MAG: hypothetical protein U5J83_19405 [Bryobacterales bacterium]|nr:hypothetical protein [Bryobacterales bacterium]
MGFGLHDHSDPTVIEQAADAGVTAFRYRPRLPEAATTSEWWARRLKSRRDKLTSSSKSKSSTYAQAMEHLETTLRELQTDHIDIWYLHALANPSRGEGRVACTPRTKPAVRARSASAASPPTAI